jgi:hypothetical protein
MRCVSMFLVIVGVLTVAVSAFSAEQAASQSTSQGNDQWRYALHNGEWWYWLPEGRWVYWRSNQWNNYDPQAFVSNYAAAPTYSAGPAGSLGGAGYGAQAAINSDIRPFYGHAQSGWGNWSSGPNEIGPFYGHAMPGEVFPGLRGRGTSIRPFYGHATGY